MSTARNIPFLVAVTSCSESIHTKRTKPETLFAKSQEAEEMCCPHKSHKTNTHTNKTTKEGNNATTPAQFKGVNFDKILGRLESFLEYGLGNCCRIQKAWGPMSGRSPHWILGQKEGGDIRGKTVEIQIKSGASLIIICQCRFLDFDKRALVISKEGHGRGMATLCNYVWDFPINPKLLPK